jgi:large subunit ribosomal protein L24
MAAKIKKGDTVLVTAGSDKGKKGVVKSVCPATQRAVVEGVNVSRRFKKRQGELEAQKTSVERSIHLSNLSFFVSSTGQVSRVGFKIQDDGAKVRFLKKSGEVIDV